MSSLFDKDYFDHLYSVLDDFNRFIDLLPMRFDADLFRRIRLSTGTQMEWAKMVGVSGQTISNYENGNSPPRLYYRRRLLEAASKMRDQMLARELPSTNEVIAIDPVETTKRLNDSVLTASLTDFYFNRNSNLISPRPFSDYSAPDTDAYRADLKQLLDAQAVQAEVLVAEIAIGNNANTEKLCRYLERYRSSCASDDPNPRVLNFYGQVITRGTNEDDLRSALSDFDTAALDIFISQHLELMRLYFQEALAKAQKLEASEIGEISEDEDGSDFYQIAEIMENARDAAGSPLVSKSIPTVLRDISLQMRDLRDAIIFNHGNSARLSILKRRRAEFFKTGSVYVARFVFVGALIAAVASPDALSVTGSIASIIGLIEQNSPGTLLKKYEALRRKFPLLPRLPSDKN